MRRGAPHFFVSLYQFFFFDDMNRKAVYAMKRAAKIARAMRQPFTLFALRLSSSRSGATASVAGNCERTKMPLVGVS